MWSLQHQSFPRFSLPTFFFPTEKPDKLNVKIERSQRSATLAWVVTFDGNSPVTNFTVEHFDSRGWNEWYTLSSDQNQLKIEKLKLGILHYFTVTAKNAVGSSDPVTVTVSTLDPGENIGDKGTILTFALIKIK